MKKQTTLIIITIVVIVFVALVLPRISYAFFWGGDYLFAYDIKSYLPKFARQEKLCDVLFNENDRFAEYGYLLDRCYRDMGILKNDEKICENIKTREQQLLVNDKLEIVPVSDHRDSCYRSIALKKQQEAICDKMLSESNKSFCYSDIAREK
jgi:hypothetical protein